MKYFILGITALFSLNVLAQKIETVEGNENFKDGMKNCFSVMIYENDANKVEKEFKALLKDRKPKKVESKKGEFMADDATFVEWENGLVDVYFRIKEIKKNEIQLITAYEMGFGFLSSEKEKSRADFIKKYLSDFAYKLSADAINDQIKEATKQVEKLTDKSKDLVKENESLNKDVANYKEKIVKAENELKENANNQSKTKNELQEAQSSLNKIKDKFTSLK
jgi:DNA repair exonuclease SbcCD ATPase subunit